jgi:ribosomal protein S18 acetylase RimI-like enzyme
MALGQALARPRSAGVVRAREAGAAEQAMPELHVRDLCREDVAGVARIDALHTGRSKRRYWEGVFGRFLQSAPGPLRIGLGAEAAGRLVGYLLGEVRAFEFGSEECGWIFAVAVDPGAGREGVGSHLLAEACARFRDGGVPRVRTMVRRNDVPVLAFFRGNGFRGGPFVQLELDLDET